MMRLLSMLVIIPLYYIAGQKSMFLYAITLSLYNIYLSCFSHITIKSKLKKVEHNYSKFKILKLTSLIITITCVLFIVTSIIISDALNTLLNIENTFLPFLLMSISIITEPIIKIFLEYLESFNKPKLSTRLLKVYSI